MSTNERLSDDAIRGVSIGGGLAGLALVAMITMTVCRCRTVRKQKQRDRAAMNNNSSRPQQSKRSDQAWDTSIPPNNRDDDDDDDEELDLESYTHVQQPTAPQEDDGELYGDSKLLRPEPNNVKSNRFADGVSFSVADT